MNFIGKCNGISLNGRKLAEEESRLVMKVFPKVFAEFKNYVQGPGYDPRADMNPDLRLDIGERCRPNGVFDRLRGHDITASFTIEEWVADALRDCAGADYWYNYEKEW